MNVTIICLFMTNIFAFIPIFIWRKNAIDWEQDAKEWKKIALKYKESYLNLLDRFDPNN